MTERVLVIPDAEYDPARRVPAGMDRVDPGERRSWNAAWPEYDRLVTNWTLASTLAAHARGVAHDPAGQPPRDLRDINGRPVHYDSRGRPLNPNGRTGVGSGLGALWFWGPRFAADAVVVDRDTREVLVAERLDNGRVCFPGGMFDEGERSVHAALRELREETGYALRRGPDASLWAGPMQDYRQTDHAWIESGVHLWFLRPDEVGQELRSQDGETKAVRWERVDALVETQMNPGHDLILRLLREKLPST